MSDRPGAAAAPKFTHAEMLDGFRAIVKDLNQFYEGKKATKHSDYPDALCTQRTQIAFAIGILLKQVGPALPALDRIADLVHLFKQDAEG